MEKLVLKRNIKLLKCYIGKVCYIHNGLILKKLIISKEMIGHKVGEFVYTKKMSNKIHNQKKKKKKKWAI